MDSKQILNLVMTAAIWIAVFYFVLILPNKKKQKKHQEMVSSLSKGVEVLTSGGIKGTIVSTTADYAEIEVDKGVKLTIRKAAIATILTQK